MEYTIGTQAVSTRDIVYRSLKNQILLLELPPGTGISEKEISLKFNVSRTPVRESFVRLAQEGLLAVYPQRGTVVSLIDPELVEEARFMREHLERAVIREACLVFPQIKLLELKLNLDKQQLCIEAQDYKEMFMLDEEFHQLIFTGSNKKNTWEVVQQIKVHLNRSRMLKLTADHNWEHLYQQHYSLYEAIGEHDPARADLIMQEHMALTLADQEILMAKYPQYFKQG
ncbi:GntR family transcriptional regulator [Paenibacillus sp. MMS20-IR301]|uniref:GntR family transcriptional regulator n=1 Tax=Paenibacillus sp. MMS20-IR301 TaxID=2895946 RepID=UPI0028E4970B|nr:GntR family transcriptional regulator [Paenibacillus sp. MMS20-IR301]WNS45418.1 GntR family transcriptional regulator [Paenibacillus sp. MMS20-IR301]